MQVKKVYAIRSFNDFVRCVLLAVMMTSLQAATPDEKPRVTAATDRESALYEINEPITFKMEVRKDDQPVEGKVLYRLSNDGGEQLAKGELPLQDGKATLEWKQETPAIVRCDASYYIPGTPLSYGRATAAVAPLQIGPTATEPADFMEFWRAEIDKLAKVPINAQLTPIRPSSKAPENIEVFEITLDNIEGSHVTGYFAKPVGNGPFPTAIRFPGAGQMGDQVVAEYLAGLGFLGMSIHIHEVPAGILTKDYLKHLHDVLKGYEKRGREKRETYYFRRVIMGDIRAVDYLASRPDWDRKHLIAYGASQGGGLTLIAAGLDARITAGAAGKPALAEHSGRNFGRPSGWPRLASLSSPEKLDAGLLEVAQYYDAVNFARYVHIPMIFGEGLLDDIAPTTTGLAAFNLLPGPKSIEISPNANHFGPPISSTRLERFLKLYGGLEGDDAARQAFHTPQIVVFFK